MKNFKKGMLALALLAGIGGAFVTKTAHAAKPQDPTYNWTEYNRSGVVIGTLNNATVSQAQSTFSCSGSVSLKCGVATAGPTIYYN
ncbi:hypothetical protein [Mucilaginibacter flavus]|uniref:hypothetical protein n=1 Tax=Mucilaginibacter flavus TaxID=931504 RepID=UPI0025B466F9|nr:hypothetical protein [Mucilaginibacter flavus]MDN3584559.1 hypothetical protein [Mucilaginibacter flavus]